MAITSVRKYFYIIVLPLVFIFSCSSSNTDDKVVPSDLSVNITIVGATVENQTGDGTGRVSVRAFAKNATRYAFRFGGDDLLESSTGSIEYTFSKIGTNTYNIVAYAYSKDGESIQKSATVEVLKDDPSAIDPDPDAEDPDDPQGDNPPPPVSLVFSDEFDYSGPPDPDKWHHQTIPIIGGDWANGELQHYTDRLDNSYVSDGTLKIKAIKEVYSTAGTTKDYTSARLNSKFAFTYGRIDVRAKLPVEEGTWPAIWTLGANINEIGNYFGDQFGSVGWPACGEIDIMEQRGWDKSKTIAYFHWGDTVTGAYNSTGCDNIPVADSTTEFHIYSLVWDSSSMKVLVDDQLVCELSNTSDKPYDNQHYLLLNIAMGGNLGGTVPGNFNESVMEIDFVRFYQ